jgi:hypothetical protein
LQADPVLVEESVKEGVGPESGLGGSESSVWWSKRGEVTRGGRVDSGDAREK